MNKVEEVFSHEEVMEQWDSWREYIAQGGSGSWPRDAFEALLDHFKTEYKALEADMEYWRKTSEAHVLNIKSLQSQIKVMRDALKKHGQHSGSCNYYKSVPFSYEARLRWIRCTCGLDKLTQETQSE